MSAGYATFRAAACPADDIANNWIPAPREWRTVLSEGLNHSAGHHSNGSVIQDQPLTGSRSELRSFELHSNEVDEAFPHFAWDRFSLRPYLAPETRAYGQLAED